MKKVPLLFLSFTCAGAFAQTSKTSRTPTVSNPKTVTLTKDALQDKIKGGWAGQIIGVTYGGPMEFRYNGTFFRNTDPLRGTMVIKKKL